MPILNATSVNFIFLLSPTRIGVVRLIGVWSGTTVLLLRVPVVGLVRKTWAIIAEVFFKFCCTIFRHFLLQFQIDWSGRKEWRSLVWRAISPGRISLYATPPQANPMHSNVKMCAKRRRRGEEREKERRGGTRRDIFFRNKHVLVFILTAFAVSKINEICSWRHEQVL